MQILDLDKLRKDNLSKVFLNDINSLSSELKDYDMQLRMLAWLFPLDKTIVEYEINEKDKSDITEENALLYIYKKQSESKVVFVFVVEGERSPIKMHEYTDFFLAYHYFLQELYKRSQLF